MLASKETEEEKKQPSVQNKDGKSIMVLWDFDWSLINGNSDFYVMRKLYGGKQEYDRKIYRELDAKAASEGVTVFTNIMDKYAWPRLFHDHKLTKESFAKHLCSIPVFPSNVHIIKTLGNDSYKGMVEQYVVSDANTVLIEDILAHHKLWPNIIPSNKIYTNPGWYDEKTGIMRCKRYHTEDNPHNCPLDKESLNICKGKILEEEIMKDKKNPSDIVRIFIGDGWGDYCPITRFNQNDFAFVRKGKSLGKK
eukprot:340063_1